MAQSLVKTIADFNTTLSSRVAVGDTTATLTSATDDDSVALPTGTYVLTIDRKSSSKEYIQCTLTGTALTNIKTLTRGTAVASSGFARTHRKGAEVIISDFAAIKRITDLLDGTTNFDSGTPLAYDGTVTPTAANQFATKSYVDATATGTTNFDRTIVAGTAGETITKDQLLYLKASDGRWWLVDSDTASTDENVILGIAQGTGTAGNAISNGVLTYGLATFTAITVTANTKYYTSNTAGAFSSSAGTTEVTVGYAVSTTQLFFNPRYDQQLTEGQQDALVGNNTDIIVGTGNLFVTQTGLQKNAEVYAASTTGNDTYVVTLSPVPTSLVNGMTIRFKPDTANTGAATLNVNSLGALSIVTGLSTALVTGDILANQVCEVIYNSTGTVWQLVNPASVVLTGTIYKNGVTTKNISDADATETIAHGLSTTPKRVRFWATSDSGTQGAAHTSFGSYDSSGQSGIFSGANNSTKRGGNSATKALTLISDQTFTGYSEGTVSVDSTNISIAWVKTNSPASQTFQIHWEAEG